MFHEDLVRSCGNETLIIVLGAVETLWSAHVDELTRATGDVAPFADLKFRAHSLSAHVAITDAIEKGDSELAARLARDHMHEPNKHEFMDSNLTVRSTAVRHAADAAGHRPAH
jgi:DNA-binding FadR family transcriptional regulator